MTQVSQPTPTTMPQHIMESCSLISDSPVINNKQTNAHLSIKLRMIACAVVLLGKHLEFHKDGRRMSCLEMRQ
jgi:hypothetical protein